MSAPATICPSIRAADSPAGYYFPVDAEYAIKVQLGQGGGGGRGGPEVRQKISAGLRTIGVTFLRESTKPEIGLLPLGLP